MTDGTSPTLTRETLWVLRAQSGDREALELLLRSVQPSLRRFLANLVGVADADDVLQEVLVLIYRKLGWLETPELVRPWAFRIASRAALRWLRRRRRRLVVEAANDELVEQQAAPAAPASDVLDQLHTLDGLTSASRAVLILHFAEDLPLRDVAVILELPLGTVKSRLAYGLAALRKALADRRT